jgi:hypothetical protein
MRLLCILLLTICCSVGIAQEPTPQPSAPKLEMIVEQKIPINKNILFIVDRSGSMDNGLLERAITVVLSIVEPEHAIDELNVAAVVFNDRYVRWDGHPSPAGERQPPKGWASLPNPEAVKALNEWVDSYRAGGSTHVIPALVHGLMEPINELTIVVVSDGIFSDPVGMVGMSDALRNIITDGQKEREKMGLNHAVLLAYGVSTEGSSTGPTDTMKVIGDLGQGGYLHELVPPPPPPPETEDAPPDPNAVPYGPPPPPIPPMPFSPRVLWRFPR